MIDELVAALRPLANLDPYDIERSEDGKYYSVPCGWENVDTEITHGDIRTARRVILKALGLDG